MMYKSEAEAYQAMRRDWKQQRKAFQRSFSYDEWAMNNKTYHPQIRKRMAIDMPFRVPVVNTKRMDDARELISQLTLRLNRYKVDKHDR